MELTHLVFWHWWILAGILLVLELLSMTFYLLWIAIAAFITGLVKWLFPSLSLEWQCVIFAFWAIDSVYLWWRYQRKQPLTRRQSDLNNRSQQYIGQSFSLYSAVVNGSGKVQIGDSQWLVRCDEDLPKGTKVKVVAAEGATLVVTAFI